MEVTQISTTELRSMAAPYNPRTISDHDLVALGRSMTTFGVVEPVVVNKRTGRVVGGHQRVKAAEAQRLFGGQEDPFDGTFLTDDIAFKLRFTFGADEVDWRGTYMSNGTV